MKRETETLIVRAEKEPYSCTGMAWRAYMEDGTPLYLGSETLEGLRARIYDDYPECRTLRVDARNL